MSVDIAWETFTAGPDGAALGEKIRDFMHDKFQTITLPRFIKAVHVHSFEFGTVSPEIDIKDICDPLPDFYEDDDESDDEGNDDNSHLTSAHENASVHNSYPPDILSPVPEMTAHGDAASSARQSHTDYHSQQLGTSIQDRLRLQTGRSGSVDTQGYHFPRSGTPGIPGGTSNLSYFHLPLGGLSGAQTPLAAVASGTPFSPGPWHHDQLHPLPQRFFPGNESGHRPRRETGDSIPSPDIGSPFDPSSPESRPVTYPSAEKVSDDLTLENLSISPTMQDNPQNPSDLQVVARVNYDGNVRMTLTAEILLDYPMPSFVGIPLKLSVTGMKFDGVAILAYIKKRMHFCFLDPEDAQTLVGDQVMEEDKEGFGTKNSKSTFGGLLREVYVESEIGKKEDGKQVLKNVGKVEKFVLEQVRRIFEEEFVFPSFWTFLV